MIFAISPLVLPQQSYLPFFSLHTLGAIFLALIIVYLFWSGLSRKPLRIKNWSFPHLSIKFSLGQIGITSFDWLLAAAVLYFLLPVPNPISFEKFLAIYLLG